MIDLIHRLNARGMTFLVIEHNLKVVRAFSQRVIVLDHGAKIAEGNAARRAERSAGRGGLSRQEAWRGAHERAARRAGIGSGYGDVPVLGDVSLTVGADEIVSVVGANGAGKTTLLSTISGLLPCTAGAIRFDGEQIERLPAHDVVTRRLVMVPEGGRLFPFMTVLENLELGAFNAGARPNAEGLARRRAGAFPDPRRARDSSLPAASRAASGRCARSRVR